MNKIKNITIFILLLLSLGISLYNFYIHKKEKYADTTRLFQEFVMTKELEAKEAPTLDQYKAELDSLNKIFNQTKNLTQLNDLKRQYLILKEDYNSYYTKSNKDINDLVWIRLNKIISDFGKNNNFEIIIGANGMGTVLYANPANDVTNDLISYANKSFKNAN